MLNLGDQPTAITVHAEKGQGFDEYLRVPESDPFPAGTSVKMQVNDRRDLTVLAVWPAVLVEPGGCRVVVDQDDMDALPNFALVRVFVTYPGNRPVCWYRGPLIRSV